MGRNSGGGGRGSGSAPSAKQIIGSALNTAKEEFPDYRRGGYPPSKAQQQVLDALGVGGDVTSYQQAEQLFNQLGMEVTSRREGRRSVPVITEKPRIGGGFTREGEGASWDLGPGIPPAVARLVSGYMA